MLLRKKIDLILDFFAKRFKFILQSFIFSTLNTIINGKKKHQMKNKKKRKIKLFTNRNKSFTTKNKLLFDNFTRTITRLTRIRHEINENDIAKHFTIFVLKR